MIKNYNNLIYLNFFSILLNIYKLMNCLYLNKMNDFCLNLNNRLLIKSYLIDFTIYYIGTYIALLTKSHEEFCYEY